MHTLRGLCTFSGAAVCLFLTACVKPAPVQFYAEPVLGPGTVTIRGETIDPGALEANVVSFATDVDGDLISKPDLPQGRKVAVTAGPHFITLGCRTANVFASISVSVDIKAGNDYLVKCDPAPSKLFEQRYANVWLETNAGQPVTEKKVAGFSAGGGGAVIVPVFIHK